MSTGAGPAGVRSGTVDVSRPRAATPIQKAVGIVGDLGLAVLLVLMLPILLIAVGAPLALLTWAISVFLERASS